MIFFFQSGLQIILEVVITDKKDEVLSTGLSVFVVCGSGSPDYDARLAPDLHSLYTWSLFDVLALQPTCKLLWLADSFPWRLFTRSLY